LPALLLLLPAVVQAQHCFVHDAGQVKDVLDLLTCGYPGDIRSAAPRQFSP
jgi:hypothetical protein